MTDQLPYIPTAQQLVDAVGWDAAMSIISRWGGVTIHLPRGEPSSMLTDALGADVARLLCVSLGPGPFAVPKAVTWLAAFRDKEIAARRSIGETERGLALRFNLSARQVRRICSAAKEAA